ncbi:MAG: bifunctional DNA primase/polymerase [Alphaproteobacteria bacterium]|nr:bifunctional DNA primase/polymerase [Alphaproteobacteria bacterium]
MSYTFEHGWSMPRGFVRHEERDPRNYSLAEWQQAKRAKKDPARLKAMFQDCWAISDSRATFAHALKECGYILARGDRRGVVAVDHNGEVYAIARWVGIKTRQVADKIANTQTLPDVTAAKERSGQAHY